MTTGQVLLPMSNSLFMVGGHAPNVHVMVINPVIYYHSSIVRHLGDCVGSVVWPGHFLENARSF